jgi:hypothetical protein
MYFSGAAKKRNRRWETGAARRDIWVRDLIETIQVLHFFQATAHWVSMEENVQIETTVDLKGREIVKASWCFSLYLADSIAREWGEGRTSQKDEKLKQKRLSQRKIWLDPCDWQIYDLHEPEGRRW